MANIDYTSSYEAHVAKLQQRLSRDSALKLAVGGDFVAVGKLEYHLLRSLGLKDGDLVVDVGCGCGRLACHLATYSQIRYIGCDVVEDLLVYARELCLRDDWLFVKNDGKTIPCEDNTADFTCFFSVFTHLLHEDTYRYFLETRRVLKPKGKLVFSFLEFAAPSHWNIFIDSVNRGDAGQHLNQFLDRDAIRVFAEKSGYEVESIRSGDTFHIPIPEEIVFESGGRMGTLGTFGQSVAVLNKLP